MYTMKLKRILGWMLAVTMVLGLLPSAVLATGTGFTDVTEDSWFREAVEYVTAEELMVGIGHNKFDPEGRTTRAMVVTVLHRMEGNPEENSAGFDDVAENLWYAEAINWAQAKGIVEGYGDGTFRPDAAMTREEMVAVFYRYAEYKGYDTTATETLRGYADRRSIQTYAVDAMEWAVSTGLINGFSDGTVRPREESTRAQLATVLMRFHESVRTEPREGLLNFESDEVYFVSGNKTTVTFTVEAYGDIDRITLIRNNNEAVGIMHDDGLNGDMIANDDIFTFTLEETVISDSLQTYTYYCESSTHQSNCISIYYFAPLTQETAVKAREDYEYVQQQIANIEQQYLDANGYVAKESRSVVIDEVIDRIELWIAEGKVLHYAVEECAIYIKFTSGLGSVYEPASENTDSIGINTEMEIITCQPNFDEMGGENYNGGCYELPNGVNYVLEMIDDAATDIDNRFTNYMFPVSRNYDDGEVTLDVINSFGSNQIILWHGHGYYGPIVKSSLLTGEPFDWNAYYWSVPYFNNCVTNRFVNSLIVHSENVIITSKYIDHYCGNMTNSLVYLAACNSGKTDELAKAFLKKGASAVVANSDTIIRDYNVVMMYETMSKMQTVNQRTGNYYTLSEALAAAKARYGNSDGDTRYGGRGATPLIFGGTAANTYRLRDVNDEIGTLSGKISKASDRITAIPNASIEVYKDGVLYKSSASNSNGNYTINLPAGRYLVKISSEGYIDFKAYATVAVSGNTYMETFLLIEGSEAELGVASGKVVNSLTGTGVAGVTLMIRRDWNNDDASSEVIKTAVTDSNGNYSVELPLGNYSVIATKNGFTSSAFNIIVQEGTTGHQNGTITPLISGDDYLVTLTWGQNPRDLDSHVVGTLSNGARFHVYYSHASQYDGNVEVCNLDYDDTDSYGPEHITLNTTNDMAYYYYVYKFAGSGTIANSDAKITVEQGNTLIAEFNVPTDLGDGDYWNVFAIKNGELIVNNTITSSPALEYAN